MNQNQTTPPLTDTVGATTVTTQKAPEGDRWMSVVQGGAWDGYVAVMDLTGDPAALHAQVLGGVKAAPNG